MASSGKDSPLYNFSGSDRSSVNESAIDIVIPIVDGQMAPPLVGNPYTPSNEDVESTGSIGSVVSAASSKRSSAATTSTPLPFLHPYSGSGSHQSASGGTRLPNPPSLVSFRRMRFLIMDAPSETNLHLYIKEMERFAVTDVVRVCDPSYPKEVVERHGIKVHELIFPDGEGPPDSIVSYWLSLVQSRFAENPLEPEETAITDGDSAHSERGHTIAIHCVAGLGRAPVLVAIALIESGMAPFDAITYIRERRRGAINTKQLKFLESYRRRGRSASQPKCCIM